MNNDYTTKQYLMTHHPESFLLRNFKWIVFGHVSFPRTISQSHNDGSRIRKFTGLMFALAIQSGIKPRKLVCFQNNELKPESGYHHIHFLLGPENLEHCTTDEICAFLAQKAAEFEFGECAFSPYDSTKDGIGYVTKRVFIIGETGKRKEIQPEFFLSPALRKLIQQKDSQ